MTDSTNDWLPPVLAQILIDSGISFTVDPGLAGNAIKRAEEAINQKLIESRIDELKQVTSKWVASKDYENVGFSVYKSDRIAQLQAQAHKEKT